MEINAQDVIDNLLEQNKQLTLQIAILRAHLGLASNSDKGPDETAESDTVNI